MKILLKYMLLIRTIHVSDLLSTVSILFKYNEYLLRKKY